MSVFSIILHSTYSVNRKRNSYIAENKRCVDTLYYYMNNQYRRTNIKVLHLLVNFSGIVYLPYYTMNEGV